MRYVLRETYYESRRPGSKFETRAAHHSRVLRGGKVHFSFVQGGSNSGVRRPLMQPQGLAGIRGTPG